VKRIENVFENRGPGCYVVEGGEANHASDFASGSGPDRRCFLVCRGRN
jgi:hypothetical protein